MPETEPSQPPIDSPGRFDTNLFNRLGVSIESTTLGRVETARDLQCLDGFVKWTVGTDSFDGFEHGVSDMTPLESRPC